jgi:hypothetical protein
MTTQSKTKFIIFGQGRSGSDLLRSLINSHPDIYCDIELFNPAMLKKDHPVFRYVIQTLPLWYVQKRKQKYADKSYGFKLFLWQLKQAESVTKKLSEAGWKIIHIQRMNVVKQAFSAQIGVLTHRYQRTSNTPIPEEVYKIDVKDLVGSVKFRIQQLQLENKVVETLDHFKVVYEDDLKDENNWNDTMKKVFQYLEQEPVIVQSSLLVTDARNDSERIENFDEIIQYLQNNGFEEQVKNYFRML